MLRSRLYGNYIAALRAERKRLGRQLNEISHGSSKKTEEQRARDWPMMQKLDHDIKDLNEKIKSAAAVVTRALEGEEYWYG